MGKIITELEPDTNCDIIVTDVAATVEPDVTVTQVEQELIVEIIKCPYQ